MSTRKEIFAQRPDSLRGMWIFRPGITDPFVTQSQSRSFRVLAVPWVEFDPVLSTSKIPVRLELELEQLWCELVKVIPPVGPCVATGGFLIGDVESVLL
jgi:hypothetical protein